MYFVAFAFCYICILAICILFFCILSCLYFGIFVFCPVVFCFVWLYFGLFVLWNICILSGYRQTLTGKLYYVFNPSLKAAAYYKFAWISGNHQKRLSADKLPTTGRASEQLWRNNRFSLPALLMMNFIRLIVIKVTNFHEKTSHTLSLPLLPLQIIEEEDQASTCTQG